MIWDICWKHQKVNIHRSMFAILYVVCRHDHQNACYWYLPPYKWCCFLCASSLHTPFPSFRLHCQTSSAHLFAPGFANFSFSAMFCHLNFCQMLLPQFSPLQYLPYFNFIHIFCHLIFFYFYIFCFYRDLQREKSDVLFVRSGFLQANNAFFSQLLFISHNFALLFSLGMRQGPKDLKLTWPSGDQLSLYNS